MEAITLFPDIDTNSYRWYLCVEKSFENWLCEETTAKKALDGFNTSRRTKAIPINKYVPKIFHKNIITKDLTPTVKLLSAKDTLPQ